MLDSKYSSTCLTVAHRPYSRLAAWFLLTAAFFIHSGVALSHSNDYLATIQGPHGGSLQMADMYHFELLIRDGVATVWVTDHGDQPQDTVGAKAEAMVINNGERVTVALAPSGKNQLVGLGPRIKSTPNARVVLTVTMKGHPPLQARYAPGAKAEAEAMQHHH